MNRFKEEEMRKREKVRQGLTPEEIKALDIQDAENAAIAKLARKIHAHSFPEEYDFMYDSHADASDREKGRNPMSDEYIAKVKDKRGGLGVSELSENGMPSSKDTWALCRKEAAREISGLRTRIDEIIFYKWDPLHISNSNWSRDEYESYAPEVVRLALESKTYHPIADYLTHVATEVMSMTENREHDIEVAELIFSLASDQTHFPDHRLVEVE